MLVPAGETVGGLCFWTFMRLPSAGTPWSPALGPQHISGMQMCGVDTAAGVLSLTTAVLPWDLLTLRWVCRQRAVQAGSILELICDLGAFRPSPFIIIRFKQKRVYCERGHVGGVGTRLYVPASPASTGSWGAPSVPSHLSTAQEHLPCLCQHSWAGVTLGQRWER